jgi:dienelactone hydrolase
MTSVALFHSVLGVRPGIGDAATRLRSAGHDVIVVDQYEGRSFDRYEEAGEYAESIGYAELMRRALAGVAELPDGLAVMGFSNGGAMATYVALRRPVSRVVLCSGALPLEQIAGVVGAGVEHWPPGVAAQLHYAVGDPFKRPGSAESVMRSVNEAGAFVEYFQYPGKGHLFTDPDLADEFDPGAAEQLWGHVIRFLHESDSCMDR